jgi:hypothetical protein
MSKTSGSMGAIGNRSKRKLAPNGLSQVTALEQRVAELEEQARRSDSERNK